MLKGFWNLLFPPKCVLCRKLLSRQEQDLCRRCRIEAPEYPMPKNHISFVAGWTAVWYYRGDVRESLLRYKFRNVRSYAGCYGRQIAELLRSHDWTYFDLVTWVPVSAARKAERGYDQVELIAQEVAKELNLPLVPTLKKIRNTLPQSGFSRPDQRLANVKNVYIVPDRQRILEKRILLLDDIITTGATVCECSRVLSIAGAKKIYCASVAAAEQDK